jgi:hypothetical protein
MRKGFGFYFALFLLVPLALLVGLGIGHLISKLLGL